MKILVVEGADARDIEKAFDGATVTELLLSACFAEWQRRYLADPGNFAADWPMDTPEEYGAACAAYMEQLAAELGYKVNG